MCSGRLVADQAGLCFEIDGGSVESLLVPLLPRWDVRLSCSGVSGNRLRERPSQASEPAEAGHNEEKTLMLLAGEDPSPAFGHPLSPGEGKAATHDIDFAGPMSLMATNRHLTHCLFTPLAQKTERGRA